MRLKKATKFIFLDLKNSIAIFYLIMFVVMAFFGVIMSGNGGNSSFGGFEFICAIVLFILGLNSFRRNYLFLSTNGISRKTQFQGFLLAILPLTAIMTVFNEIWGFITSRFARYDSLFEQIYENADRSPGNVVVSCLWSMSLFLFVTMLGYFITTSYYRMSKVVKIVASISVPVFFTMVFPIIDFRFFDTGITKGLYKIANNVFGVNNSKPLYGVVAFIILTAVFSSLSYMNLRRVYVKDYQR